MDHICALCNTNLDENYWKCTTCGNEYCMDCADRKLINVSQIGDTLQCIDCAGLVDFHGPGVHLDVDSINRGNR